VELLIGVAPGPGGRAAARLDGPQGVASRRQAKGASMGLVKEFREFALKGNVSDLAVGVIIGAEFGKIVGQLDDRRPADAGHRPRHGRRRRFQQQVLRCRRKR
jgi:hypothetical protein